MRGVAVSAWERAWAALQNPATWLAIGAWGATVAITAAVTALVARRGGRRE